MTRTYCDWCGTEVQNGPIGGYTNMTNINNLEMQPSYDMTESTETLCPQCIGAVKDLRTERSSKK
jgi:hypothetical protein